jgi:hypothetical protein
MLLGPVGIKEYDQSEAKQSQNVAKELFEKFAKGSNALIAQFLFFFFFRRHRLRLDGGFWSNSGHAARLGKAARVCRKCDCLPLALRDAADKADVVLSKHLDDGSIRIS